MLNKIAKRLKVGDKVTAPTGETGNFILIDGKKIVLEMDYRHLVEFDIAKCSVEKKLSRQERLRMV